VEFGEGWIQYLPMIGANWNKLQPDLGKFGVPMKKATPNCAYRPEIAITVVEKTKQS